MGENSTKSDTSVLKQDLSIFLEKRSDRQSERRVSH